MRNLARAWFFAGTVCVVSVAGCGGTVQDGANGTGNGVTTLPAQGGSSESGSSGSGSSGSGSSGSGSSGSGSSGSGSCVGELDQVAASWGTCPANLCAARVWAETVCVPYYAVTKIGTCDMLTVITLDMSTHGKDCYYDLATLDGEPKLVGAAAWDDTQTYCDRTSFRIESGKTTANCGAHTSRSAIICGAGTPNPAGGAGGELGVGGGEAQPPACFNALSRTCEPC